MAGQQEFAFVCFTNGDAERLCRAVASEYAVEGTVREMPCCDRTYYATEFKRITHLKRVQIQAFCTGWNLGRHD